MAMDKTVIIFLTFYNLFYCVHSNFMCDVRQWYLKSVGQGLFDGQLSPEQEAVQSEIEDILLQGRKDPRKKSVNCILLDEFEEILENKSFNTENNKLIENENEYDETDIFEEDETEIDSVESSDREEKIEDVANASENSNADTGVKQEEEEGNADTNKNDEITEKQTSDSSETNDVPEAQKGEVETNENVIINREKSDENNALENTDQERIVKQDVDSIDGILTQEKKESGVTEVPENTENVLDIEQDIKQNTGTVLAQDEKMRGGGSVNLEYSDKKLANQEQLDKSNDIENAKQEEINTKAEGVSDNIDNGSNVSPQEADQTNENPNIEQESMKQDGPKETMQQGKEDANTSIKVEDKTVDDKKEDANTVAADITSEDNGKTILSTNTQNQSSNKYNIETTVSKEQDIDNSERPLGNQDNTADQKADEQPNTLVDDLANTVEMDKNIEVQFQNTGTKVEISDTKTALLNGHTTVTNDISNKKQEIEIDVKSLEFEKYQQTFGVCRIDQSSAADVFLIRYFIQVANNTTEMEEDLIKHTSIDLSTKTKTLIREETGEQENTIDSKKQENNAENNGVPDENSHKNVEETMDLQNQPGTVEKRDIKRVETLDNVDYEVNGNIATSVGEDAAENDKLNEEDNYEKSFNSKGNQKLDIHSKSDNLGDAPTNILKKSDSKEDSTVQYNSGRLARNRLEKENIQNVNPNIVNKDAESGDVPNDKNAEQNDEDRKQKQSKDHDSINLQTSRLNIDEFFKTKTLEYSSKIQNLEILIMKLENQLLMDKLDKQNHSSTITRLENSILKLENEVLKLNHSHYDLKIENEKMNKKTKTYLELDHVQDNKSKQAKELKDQSTKSHELITEQQHKIFQLAELLKNQSKAIHHMKSKYEYLEDQNRMLFQMVMNQTTLMTQIMSRVQELSDQNMEHRVEAQLLKEKLALSKMSEQIDNKEFSKVSNKLMEKLDAIVSDKKLDMVENGSRKDQNNTIELANNDVKDESEEKLMDFISKTKQLANLTQNWCGQRKMICVYKSIRLSTCVPFVPLHWSVCEASNNNDFTLPKMEYVNDKRQTTKEYEKTENESINDTKSIDKGENIKSETENKNIRTANSKEDAFVQGSENKIVQVSAKNEQSGTVNKISENEQIDTKITKNDIETPQRSTTNVVKPATADTVNSEDKNVTGTLINEDIKKKSDSITKTSENQIKPELEDKQLEIKDTKKIQDANTADSTKQDTKTVKQDSKPVDERPPTNQKLHKTEITGKRGGDTKNVHQDDIKDKNANPDINLIQDKTTEKQNRGENAIKEKQEVSANANTEKQKPLSSSKQMENDDKHKTVERQGTGQHPTGSTPDNPNKVKTKPTDQQGKAPEKNQTGQKSQKTSPSKDKEGKKEKVHQKKTEPKNGGSQSVKQANKPKKEVKETKQTVHVADRQLRYEKKGQTEPKDCYDYYMLGNRKNTIYKIKPYGLKKTIQVHCDMKGGGWTLIQKRSDGTTKFFREWAEYKTGFGGLYGEHWLGNDYIHYLTNQENYKLRIDLTDWNKTKKFAEYQHFSIDDEKEGYKLTISGYTGDAGDGMAKHNSHKFSTKDVDNDKVEKEFGGSCANRFSGAWWYYKCYMSNLNGIYYRNGQIPPKMFDGITWKPWTGANYSLRSVEMKIKPASAKDK